MVDRTPYERELDLFVQAMRYKLKANAHKGRWENLDLESTVKLLKNEIAELERAIEIGSEIEIRLEAADIGNFALILSVIAIEQLKTSMEEPNE